MKASDEPASQPMRRTPGATARSVRAWSASAWPTARSKPDWHNAPVPAFGALTARLLIVGLAPGLRGANRTGRPFTGDYAGQLLYPTLLKFGLARGDYRERPDDGMTMVNARISNAVRCVPPQNKPDTVEIKTCNSFLAERDRGHAEPQGDPGARLHRP